MGSTDESSPLTDLGLFADKKLVILGGYGAASGGQQWRSMWDAFKNYGDGSDPPKEEIERSRGCNYYCGDCHALGFADADASAASALGDAAKASAEPEWSRLDFGREASVLLQRTGHTLTSLQAGGRLLLFGGRNLQRGEGSGASSAGGAAFSESAAAGSGSSATSCMNDAWLLELQADESRPPSLRELVAAGTPPSPRAYHTATLLGDTLYVMGGVETHRSGEVQLKDLHALHLPSYRWYTPQVQHEPPAVLARHSATALDGKLWVFGGSLRAPTSTSGGRARVRFSGQLHTLSLCISPPAATEVTPTIADAREKKAMKDIEM